MLIAWLFLLILLPTTAYWLLAWWAVRRHLLRPPTPSASFTPTVSLLKPVCGASAHSYDDFASFCRQDYPNYEILFGVRDADDPAIPIIERLQTEFPRRRIRLIRSHPVGMNPKVSTLHFLSPEASGDILVISDGDVRVEDDYLRQVVSPLQDPAIGVVTCPYRGVPAGNWVSTLAALHMDSVFLPSAVIAGNIFGVRLGLGATIAIRRTDLTRIGGFDGIADYLADDYQLASHIADLGLRIHLSHHVVTCILPPMPLAQQWDRELRWARGIRVTRPREYPGLLLTFLTSQGLALAIVLAPFDQVRPVGLAALAMALAVRWLVAWRIMRYLRQRRIWRSLLWLPLRDLMSAAAWAAGLFGTTVRWRENRYELMRNGRLRQTNRSSSFGLSSTSPLPGGLGRGQGEGSSKGQTMLVPMGQTFLSVADIPVRNPPPPNLLARGILHLDRWLRRRQGIFEYFDHPECILRIGVERSDEPTRLSDGTTIAAGEPIGQFHFWNEHLPRIPPAGPGLKWASTIRRRFGLSLRALAERIKADPRLKSVRAFRATVAFAPHNRPQILQRILTAFGFDLITPKRPPTWRSSLHRFGESILIMGLLWTFNPFNGTRPTQRRYHFWISRKTLATLHTPPVRA